MVERIFHGESLSDGKQDILQTVFSLAAVLPSIINGLIPLKELTVSGDGTAVKAHANPFGRNPQSCRKSSYGRTVYIKNSSDLRLHPRIQRDIEQYKTIYSERSACERMNDRVLNNYHLQDLKIRGDDHFSFWTMIIGICIHLDAWYKMSSMSKQTA